MIENELQILIQENENLFKQRDSLREELTALKVALSEAFRIIETKRMYGHDWDDWLKRARKALQL